MELELKTKKLPSLEVYDVLWTLEQSPTNSMRFYELSERVYLARFNITRICDRLVKEGFIEKMICPEDKRGIYAKITKRGLSLRKKMWSIYGKNIETHFSLKLNQQEHKSFIKLLAKISTIT